MLCGARDWIRRHMGENREVRYCVSWRGLGRGKGALGELDKPGVGLEADKKQEFPNRKHV